MLFAFLVQTNVLNYHPVGEKKPTFFAKDFMSIIHLDVLAEEGWNELVTYVTKNMIDIDLALLKIKIEALSDEQIMGYVEVHGSVLMPILSEMELLSEKPESEVLKIQMPPFGFSYLRKLLFDYLSLANFGLIDLYMDNQEIEWLDETNEGEVKMRLAIFVEEMAKFSYLSKESVILQQLCDNPDVSAQSLFVYVISHFQMWLNDVSMPVEHIAQLLCDFADIVIFNEESSVSSLGMNIKSPVQATA